jgi:hypothetical protein
MAAQLAVIGQGQTLNMKGFSSSMHLCMRDLHENIEHKRLATPSIMSMQQYK